MLIGYELGLSKRLKQAADVWLNNPRVPREASGTSGMTAAMNGAVNFSTDDGWIPEFINHGNNGFVVPQADYANMTVQQQDQYDLDKLYEILEKEILPLYYDNYDTWRQIAKNGMRDVRFQFESGRMALSIMISFISKLSSLKCEHELNFPPLTGYLQRWDLLHYFQQLHIENQSRSGLDIVCRRQHLHNQDQKE